MKYIYALSPYYLNLFFQKCIHVYNVLYIYTLLSFLFQLSTDFHFMFFSNVMPSFILEPSGSN